MKTYKVTRDFMQFNPQSITAKERAEKELYTVEATNEAEAKEFFKTNHNLNPFYYQFKEIENLEQNNNLNIQYLDLFEHYEMQPPKLKEVIDRWDEKFTDELSYEEVAQLLQEIEKVGYTFDYYLDATPYGLRPIGVKLNQLKGWEDIDN